MASGGHTQHSMKWEIHCLQVVCCDEMFSGSGLSGMLTLNHFIAPVLSPLQAFQPKPKLCRPESLPRSPVLCMMDRCFWVPILPIVIQSPRNLLHGYMGDWAARGLVNPSLRSACTSLKPPAERGVSNNWGSSFGGPYFGRWASFHFGFLLGALICETPIFREGNCNRTLMLVEVLFGQRISWVQGFWFRI